MHVKTLIIDEQLVLTGSVNLTHNGLENNKEHLFCISEPKVVADVLSDFEKEWIQAEPVTEDMIELMLDKYEKRKNDKHDKQRETSRSLSAELEEADEIAG